MLSSDLVFVWYPSNMLTVLCVLHESDQDPTEKLIIEALIQFRSQIYNFDLTIQ